MIKQPRISIALCTYNGERFIKEQLLSIISQTLLPHEIVIGDDGSCDETLAIIEELRPQVETLGIQLHVHHNNHLGAHGNFKETLPLAACELIAPCDQDDIWLPDKLEKCVAAMTNSVDVVCCNEYIIHEGGLISDNLIKKPESVLDQLFGTNLAGHLLLFRRELLDVYRIAPEITFDYGLTIAASCSNRIGHVEEKLCYWRRHNAVVTTSASNHNPYGQIHMGKWKKWCKALQCSLEGYRSLPVENRYLSIEKIVDEYYVAGTTDKQRIIQLCRCMQRQSMGALINAGWCYMLLRMRTLSYKKLDFKSRIANSFFNFTYPAGWWYEYRIHKSL